MERRHMDDQGHWLDELYRETGPHLLMYLTQRTGDRHAAEDLMQQTFAVALGRPERLQSAVSPRAYLFGIARNLAATAFRSRREMEPIPPGLSAEEPSEDPRLELMREGIARLKPEFREVLELRLRHELSYEEVAEALELPVGTVRSRLHHAVKELQRVIRQREPEVAMRKVNV